ncbi:MAG: 3-phosphoshikimate 1-carboxyvinyltransferase [Clostridiales bacterium]|jgi:3-phosphoshikimate 1-carboxyvinyltransferase|nr:3-phosphoshikimate 1-carboxyvinyltransferase [Clostridiales bacterium]
MKSVTITPSKLNGSVTVPPSKSLSHRAVICAALAGGVSEISNIGASDDIDVTIEAMSMLGAVIKRDGDRLIIDGGGTLKTDGPLTLDCGESGSTLRFLIPVSLHCGDPVTFVGRGRLPNRPLDTFFPIFNRAGVPYECGGGGTLPLTVGRGDVSGMIEIEGSISSQFISGLLMALPLYPSKSEIRVTTPLESRGYVDMTIDVMRKFGIEVYNNNYHTFKVPGGQKYKPADYTVEGDFSQAAFFLAAGALGSFVVCKGLNPDSLQGDKAIVDIIKNMGGSIVAEQDGIAALPSQLRGCVIDAAQTPDLVPVAAVLGALAEGETVINNAARLRLKESDRLSAVAEQLNALGATVLEKNDGLIIEGIGKLGGGTTNGCNDHRIAMAVAVASTRCDEEIVLNGSDCVRKSYPRFWRDFETLGGKIDEWNVGESL